ncbi:MAG: 4-hydroxy-tetrahydrodipicolinate reductase [Bacteroidetes bacterium HGW-Bacteroidetes-13]|nr:MAG: 4-hydroxy-tetrahydrodipicolinate reductase [Bacteroidetes bacterium HGW-Bacteroidetes-13]
MKIALLGYGKMGKTIEQIALSRGHEIVLRAETVVTPDQLSGVDMSIEFSIPEAAFLNITAALEAGVPVISGTTGWLKNYEKAVALCVQKNGAFIYASNFSLGVNIFFQINEYLAKMMGSHAQYDISMEEIHHIHKLDKPSGTAISLAEGIIRQTAKQQWSLDKSDTENLLIESKRIGEVPGTHTVRYHSNEDDLVLTHEAHNRNGFALGAVIAAEWLSGKQGVFSMKDVLGLQNL